jgi:transposase
MYIDIVPNRNSRPCILLRESHREGKRVVKRTILNITDWEPKIVEGLRAVLQGKGGVSETKLEDAFTITGSKSHGHVAAILGTIRKVGLDTVIGPTACRERELVIAMIATRLISASSKLAIARLIGAQTCSSTINEVLHLGAVTEDNLYSALDWLSERQDSIQKKLIDNHLKGGTVVFYDVSSPYFEGSKCPIAYRGYSRDKQAEKLQIVYGAVCNEDGCPVAIEVFDGNTADPKTFSSQVKKLKEVFGIEKITWVGDRGMITSARIREDLAHNEGLDWITCLRSVDIRALANDPMQLSLFDISDLGEIEHPDYPNERLIVCRNPLLQQERTRKRDELLLATERLLAKIKDATLREKRPLKGVAAIALRVGRVIDAYKMGKHFDTAITESEFSFTRKEDSIAKERALDGIYIIRTSVSAERMSAEKAVETYKNLSKVERAFRCIKSADIAIRPIHHRTAQRVRAHVFLCMLAYYIEWHMRQALAPLLFEDHKRGGPGTERTSVVSPANRSNAARKKASRKVTDDGLPVMSFSSLLENLSSITVSTIQPIIKGSPSFQKTSIPSPLQQQAFQLLGVKL